MASSAHLFDYFVCCMQHSWTQPSGDDSTYGNEQLYFQSAALVGYPCSHTPSGKAK